MALRPRFANQESPRLAGATITNADGTGIVTLYTPVDPTNIISITAISRASLVSDAIITVILNTGGSDREIGQIRLAAYTAGAGTLDSEGVFKPGENAAGEPFTVTNGDIIKVQSDTTLTNPGVDVTLNGVLIDAS